MNCTQARHHLPALIYGDLTPSEKTAVENHLEKCLSCRQEYTALRQTRELLNRVSAPEALVDVPLLYRRAVDRQMRGARFGRRTAVLWCGAAAALVVIALVCRMEVRLQPHQVVLRWSSLPAAQEEPPSPPEARVAKVENHSSTEIEEQLQLLSQLVHALADSAEARNFRQRQEVVQLRAELRDLQWRTAQWRKDTERDVGALYTAQLISAKKGEKP